MAHPYKSAHIVQQVKGRAGRGLDGALYSGTHYFYHIILQLLHCHNCMTPAKFCHVWCNIIRCFGLYFCLFAGAGLSDGDSFDYALRQLWSQALQARELLWSHTAVRKKWYRAMCTVVVLLHSGVRSRTTRSKARLLPCLLFCNFVLEWFIFVGIQISTLIMTSRIIRGFPTRVQMCMPLLP